MQSGSAGYMISRRHVFCWLIGGASMQIASLVSRADQGPLADHPKGDVRLALGISGTSVSSIDEDLFVVLWKAAFGHVPSLPGPPAMDGGGTAGQREAAFRKGLARLLVQSPEGIRRELALFSRAASMGLGRLALFGFWSPLAQVPPERLRQSLDDMGASRFSFRRKVALGVVLVLGMSHYSQAELFGDAGYQGPPSVISGLWSTEGGGSLPQPQHYPGAVP